MSLPYPRRIVRTGLFLLLVAVVLLTFAAAVPSPSKAQIAPAVAPEPAETITLSVLGTYETGIFDESAAEIVAYDPATQRLFVVNGNDDTIDVLDIADPTNPNRINQIEVSDYGDGVNSVDVYDGIIAAAVAANPEQDPGTVVFFDTNGTYLNDVTVGALPDMVTFTPNGQYVLSANEGEPDGTDPEGSISVIDISGGVASASVETADFTAFNGTTLEDSVIIFPGKTVAEDVEPEYIAVSPDSSTAYVTMQENNALAVVDIENAEVTSIEGLGFKDHSQEGNGLDVSDVDGIEIEPRSNVFGMYQPDAIDAFSASDGTYLITANEGDARDEDAEVKSLTLDSSAFPDAATLQQPENLGNLEVTTLLGDGDSNGEYEALYAYGARSFTIWDSEGDLVYDSGDDIEEITAEVYPDDFNADNDENNSFDGRSPAKGPEPEAIEVGGIGSRTFAFVGLERIGGIMVYDVTNPASPVFVQYINNRDFDGDAAAGTAGDLGPEGILFIPTKDSPMSLPLLAVANEVSGTTTLYAISQLKTYLPLVVK